MTRADSMTARPVGMEAGASSSSSVDGAPIFLTLPVPPSLNAAYRNNRRGRGRVKTKATVDWEMYAARMIRDQKPGYIDGYVVIVMNVERRSRQADIDNRTKLVFDLLKKQAVIVDDRFVTAFATAWSPGVNHRDEDRLNLAIYPANSLAVCFHPSDALGAVGGWTIQDPAHTNEGVEHGV